jgi:hypothetical protein
VTSRACDVARQAQKNVGDGSVSQILMGAGNQATQAGMLLISMSQNRFFCFFLNLGFLAPKPLNDAAMRR